MLASADEPLQALQHGRRAATGVRGGLTAPGQRANAAVVPHRSLSGDGGRRVPVEPLIGDGADHPADGIDEDLRDQRQVVKSSTAQRPGAVRARRRTLPDNDGELSPADAVCHEIEIPDGNLPSRAEADGPRAQGVRHGLESLRVGPMTRHEGPPPQERVAQAVLTLDDGRPGSGPPAAQHRVGRMGVVDLGGPRGPDEQGPLAAEHSGARRRGLLVLQVPDHRLRPG